MPQQARATANKETVEVLCDLTPDEFTERAVAFAKLQDRIEAMEQKKRTVTEQYKNHIGGMLSRSHAMRRVVADRQEKRAVSCTWFADWASNSMLLRRDDDSTVVRSRTMTADELQQGFEWARGATEPAPGDRHADDRHADARGPVQKPARRLTSGERHARDEPTDEPTEPTDEPDEETDDQNLDF